MNHFNPGKARDSFNPNNRTTNPPPEDLSQQSALSATDNRPALRPGTESAEQLWTQIEALHRKVPERKKIDEAAKKSAAAPLTSSEPAYRTQPEQTPDRRDASNPSADKGFTPRDEKHGGVDPEFSEKLGLLKRGEISVAETNKAAPARVINPDPCVDGEWTVPHLLASLNRLPIPDLIAMGGSLDAVSKDGLTLLHAALYTRNREAVQQLLASGANPLACNEMQASPLAFALVVRQEFALELANALPDGSKTNLYEGGDSEIKMAVGLPDVLYVMLSKGMTDSQDATGKTALMLAAREGQLQSVKYLLGQRPQNEKESDFLDYLNSTDDKCRVTALSLACCSNHDQIVELLLRHGASLFQPSDQPSLLTIAAEHQNTKLLKLLLENGAAVYEADLTRPLFWAAEHGRAELISALVPYANLDHKQQFKMLSKWMNHRLPETLAAISALIPPGTPSVKSMMKSRSFRESPFRDNSPELLVAMLEFFDQRESFNYIFQSYISVFLDDQGATIDPAMGKILLEFAMQRFSRLSTDRETVMRLLQLSEQLKDYSLITQIKEKNFSGKLTGNQTIPFDAAWISDPVSLELLVMKQGQDSSRFSNFLKTVSSFVSRNDDTPAIDGAQLSNDLIFALKSDAVGDALDKVFESHRLSAIVRQALKPMLQGLVTQLYPDPANRHEAVCRFLIGYACSTLKDNPRFNQHPAFELMQSNAQWDSMSRKVNAETDVLDEVAATILGTMASVQLWDTLPDEAIRHALDSLGETDPETYLIQAFRSLGALDVPARRLAIACVSAAQRWKDQGGSIPASGKLPQGARLQLKAMITSELEALRKRASLPEQLASSAQKMDADLNIEFHEMLWWQWDLIHRAFGIVTSENTDSNSDGKRSSEESTEGTESEKS